MRLFFVFLIFWSAASNAQVARSEFYAGFSFWESPLQVLKAHNPLTSDQASARIHVKVDYDTLNRPVDIQMRLGGGLKEPAPFWAGLYVHAEQTRIAYEDNREIHRFFNRFGTRVTGWGPVWEKIYTTDNRGRYIRMEFFGRDGEPVENGWGAQYYQWHYQSDGSVIEERFSASGELMPHRRGFEFKRIRLVFGPDGHLSLMQNIDADGVLAPSESGAAQYRYYYDNRGMFLRWEVYDAEGNPAFGPTGTGGEFYINTNMGFGEIAFHDLEGNRSLHASGAAYWRAAYDRFGNISELSFYGIEGEAVVGGLGFSKHRFHWDAEGRYLMARDYRGPDGEPSNMIDGYSRVEFIRDKRGLLIEQRFFDTGANLVVSAFDKAAIIRHSYDEGGVLVSTEYLDPDGKPMPPG